MPRANRFAGLVAAGLALASGLILVSCAAPTPDKGDKGPAAAQPIPHLLAAVHLRLPVEDYLPTAQQGARLGAAQLVLIDRCMRRFGFEYRVEPVDSSQFGPRSLTDRRYGITDAEQAREHGYGLGERDPARRRQPARPDLGPDAQTVLTGHGQSIVNGQPVPQRGCNGEADRTLAVTVPEGADLQRGHRLQFESFEATRADPQVAAVLQRWSECMARRGHNYSDPLAAAADPEFAGPVTPRQLAVAVADVDCKGSTNVVGIWFTVESAYQRHRIEQDKAAFVATAAAIIARDAEAARIVG